MNDEALHDSTLDSRRFGLKIARAVVSGIDAKSLIAQIMAARTDVAILRVPTAVSAQIHRLSRAGLHPIHADTLVYYDVDLTTHQPAALRNSDLVFSEGQGKDADELSRLVAVTFEGYVSHYHANPLFSAESILAGYREWAEGYLSAADGRQLWVARREGMIVAFACCQAAADHGECEGVLYGVHPAHAGGGLYGDLIRYTQAQFKEQGFGLMKVSTQVGNFAVQRVWTREGFRMTRAYDTFHINALLSSGELAVDRTLQFSPEDIDLFAEVSGDKNGIHLSDEAARAAGFEERISHGMRAGAEFSKIFGMEIPGPGTLYLRAEMVFLRPIHPGRSYRLRVRFPTGVPASGPATAVGTIEDPDGSLCVVSYHDLLKRS